MLLSCIDPELKILNFVGMHARHRHFFGVRKKGFDRGGGI